MADRISAAEYRALQGLSEPPNALRAEASSPGPQAAAVGSGPATGGSLNPKPPNPYVGMRCELCGQLVRSDSSPAQLETQVAADGTETRSVRHLQGCPA